MRLPRDTIDHAPNSPPLLSVRRGVYRTLLRALQPIRVARVLCLRLPRTDRRGRSADHGDGYHPVHLFHTLCRGLQVRALPELTPPTSILPPLFLP